LADYRNHYKEIRTAGADVITVSVDPPQEAEALRRQLHLPFTILCDTSRDLVRAWDIYNPHERGGIARPSLFIINRDRTVRYASVDAHCSRVSASEILRILQTTAGGRLARRELYIPTPAEIFRAIRNYIRLGAHPRQS